MLFLANDKFEKTAWYMTSEKTQIEKLHKLWDWAKEVITQEVLTNIFLSKDDFKRTAWHLATVKRQKEVLHKLWEWTKMVLTQDELNNLFFIGKDRYEDAPGTWQQRRAK